MVQPTLTALTLNPGDLGDDLAGDVIDSKFWQAVLTGFSTGDGTGTIVTATTGLPVVAQTGSTWNATQSGVWNITDISGTVSLPTGASTSSLQDAANALLTAIDTDTSALVVDLDAIEVLVTSGNADLASIKTAVEGTLTVDGTGTFVVQVDSSTLPTGASTAAKQDLAIAELDAIRTAVEGTLTVNNAGTFAVQNIDTNGAELTYRSENDNWNAADKGVLIFGRDTESTPNKYRAMTMHTDGAISVHVHDELPTGSNNIGLVTAVSANDNSQNVTIGDGTNTATVRDLAANDALNVSIVDGAGNQVTSFGGSGGTSATDDSAFTAGSGSGTPAMGFFSTDTVDAGDAGVLAMDASRRLLVSIEADNVGIGGGTQYSSDAVVPTPIVGTATLVQRDDILSGLTPNEGDWAGLRCSAEGALWVQDYNSDAILADTTTIAGAVTGTEMQVDVVAALPAGTNTIGKLAANSGVDIGDVDVLSVVPGVAATNLGKARASALGATDTGVMPLAVRNDDLADLAGADGDYTPLQVDNAGALYTNQAAAENKSDSGIAAGGAPGTDDMIAAVSGKKILVTAMSLTATSLTANNVFIDNADNDLWHNTGNPFPMSIDADGDTLPGIVLPYNPAGWFKTDAVNEAVTLNTSAAQDIAWSISWIETD